jgi:hypothetical protein
MNYKVISLSVGGKNNRVFKSGDIVTDSHFHLGAAKELAEKGFLKEIICEPMQPKLFSDKIKLVIVSAVWKRHDVFKLFAKGINILKQNKLIEIDVVIAGSEGIESKLLVEKEGFKYIEIPNDPLAQKVNAPVLYAKKLNATHILCLGSDDIISPELLDIYIKYIKEGYDYIGVTDFYFYDLVSKKSSYWAGYREEWRKGHTAGAGRILSARLLNLWDWKPWENKHNKILDTSIQEKLNSTSHSAKIFSLKEKKVLAVDIKSEINMTPFKLWDNTSYIDTNIIKNKFPYICVE